MVRETRHLWVGNLPDNIREDRIREHFKRYGRVQSVKLLPRHKEEEGAGIGLCATVAFMDIKSASKAHNADHKLDERTLTTEYYEPPTPSTASTAIHIHEREDVLRGSGGGGATPLYAPRSPRFPHGPPDDHTGYDRSSHFYDRREREGEAYLRRTYHVEEAYGLRGRPRDRIYRNGPYQQLLERGQAAHHRGLNPWSYEGTASRYPLGDQFPDEPIANRRDSPRPPPVHKKRPKSRSASDSGSESGSSASHSRSRSRSSRSHSSSSSSHSGSSSSSSVSSRSRSHSIGSSKSRSPSHHGTVRRLGGVIQSAVTAPHANNTGSASHLPPAVHTDGQRPLAICVRNLPARSSDTSLKDGLFHEYKKHGKVTWVKIIGQGGDRFAIVCFKKADDAEKALEVSQDKLFFGCKIEVVPYDGFDTEDPEARYLPFESDLDEFNPRATRTLFIGNLEKDITAPELRKHFEQFGEIIEIDIKKQGQTSPYAFCQFADISSVVKAMRSMDGEHLGGSRVKLGFGKSLATNCVWVDGISEAVSEKFLSVQFHQYGQVSHLIMDRDRGHALVYFEQLAHAQQAVKEMRGMTLRNRKLQVDFASRECQVAFFDHLEKQGHIPAVERPWERRDSSFESRDSQTRFEPPVPGQRYTRYETTPRSRSASYNRSTNSTPINQLRTAAYATTGRVRSSQCRYDYYDEYTDRRYSYDEYSQGSAASHDDSYEQELREYGYSQRERREYGEERTVSEKAYSPAAYRRRTVEKSPSPTIAGHERSYEDFEDSRRRGRQKSVSDQESYPSQSPPSSRHQSPTRDLKRYSAYRGITHVGTPSSPVREVNYYEDKESSLDSRDTVKCKLSDSKCDLRDSLTSRSLDVDGARAKFDPDRSRLQRYSGASDGAKKPAEEGVKEGTPSYKRHTLQSVVTCSSRSQDRTAVSSKVDSDVEGKCVSNKVEGEPHSCDVSISDIRHLQKEKVHIQHLLDQLEDRVSSGDERGSESEAKPCSVKKLKLCNDSVCEGSGSGQLNVVGSGKVISLCDNDVGKQGDTLQCYRKSVEIRRLPEMKGRRLSSDNTKLSSKDIDVDKHLLPGRDFSPRFITKRRKTGSSSESEDRCLSHMKNNMSELSGDESEHMSSTFDKSHRESDGSRPGTPLCDERPENFPSEPRRIREKSTEGPLSLPLPRFAHQVLSSQSSLSPKSSCLQSKVSYGTKSPPPPSPTVNKACSSSPSESTHGKVQSGIVVPPEIKKLDCITGSDSGSLATSPTIGLSSPPGLSSKIDSSSDSEHSPQTSPNAPSLEERIKMLDEKYEKWSGSRSLSVSLASETLNKLDSDKFKFKHKLLDLNEICTQPSEIVKSVLAKRSIFDEDSKRLENYKEKYEPKEFPQNWNVRSSFQSLHSRNECRSSLLDIVSYGTSTGGLTSSLSLAKTFTPTKPSLLTSALSLKPPFPTCVAVSSTSRSPPTVSIQMKTPQTPKTQNSPVTPAACSRMALANVKSLQYPFPSHPPVTPTTTLATTTAPPTSPGSVTASQPVLSTCSKPSHSPPSPLYCYSVAVTVPTTATTTIASTEVAEPPKSMKNGENVAQQKQEPPIELHSALNDIPKSAETSLLGLGSPDTNAKTDAVESPTVTCSHSICKTPSHEMEEKELCKDTFKSSEAAADVVTTVVASDTVTTTAITTTTACTVPSLATTFASTTAVCTTSSYVEEPQTFIKQRRETSSSEESTKLTKCPESLSNVVKSEENVVNMMEDSDEEKTHESHLQKEPTVVTPTVEKEVKIKEEPSICDDQQNRHTSKKESPYVELESIKVEKESVCHNPKPSEKSKPQPSVPCENKEPNPRKEILPKKDEKVTDKCESEERKESFETPERRKERKDSEKETKKESSILPYKISSLNPPAGIGSKRRMSSQDSIDSACDRTKGDKESKLKREHSKELSLEPESKKTKLSPSVFADAEKEKHKSSKSSKISDRRDSKDSRDGSRKSESKKEEKKVDKSKKEDKHEKSKHEPEKKCEDRMNVNNPDDRVKEERKHDVKSKEETDRKKSRDSSDSRHEKEVKSQDSLERHKSKDKDKQKKRNKSEKDGSRERDPLKCKEDKEQMPKLEKKRDEEEENRESKMKLLKKDSKERKKKDETLPELQEDIHKFLKRDKKSERRKDESKEEHKNGNKKKEQKPPRKKEAESESENASEDSDPKPKKHSIFDIVIDEPAYISMYDKVKARSTKNMQKQEEEKRQEKLKEKFNQLKQSRAKREEKKRSTSWDEDSESDVDKDRSRCARKPNKMMITSSSEEDTRIKQEKFTSPTVADTSSELMICEKKFSKMKKKDLMKEIVDKYDTDSDIDIHNTPMRPTAITSSRVKDVRKMKERLDLDVTDEEGSARTKILKSARKGRKTKIPSDSSDDESSSSRIRHSKLRTCEIYSDESEMDMDFSLQENKQRSKHLTSKRETLSSSFQTSDEESVVAKEKKSTELIEDPFKDITSGEKSCNEKHNFSDDEFSCLQSSAEKILCYGSSLEKLDANRKSHKRKQRRSSSKKNAMPLEDSFSRSMDQEHDSLNKVYDSNVETDKLERLSEDVKLKHEIGERKRHSSKKERRKSGHKVEEERCDSKYEECLREDKKRDADIHHEFKVKTKKKKSGKQDLVNVCRSDTSSSMKRDERMEDIFGPLSDDSEVGSAPYNTHSSKIPCNNKLFGPYPGKWKVSVVYGSDSDSNLEPSLCTRAQAGFRPNSPREEDKRDILVRKPDETSPTSIDKHEMRKDDNDVEVKRSFEEKRRKKDKKKKDKKREEVIIKEEPREDHTCTEESSELMESTKNVKSEPKFVEDISECSKEDSSMHASIKSEHKRDPKDTVSTYDIFKFTDEDSRESSERPKEKKKKRKKSKEEKSKKDHKCSDESLFERKSHSIEVARATSHLYNAPAAFSLSTSKASPKVENLSPCNSPQREFFNNLFEPPKLSPQREIVSPVHPKEDFSFNNEGSSCKTYDDPPLPVQTKSDRKKPEKFIPGFGGTIDETIHETAVKSISEFQERESQKCNETDIEIPESDLTMPNLKLESKEEEQEEKPRAVISQEETEDAVAALLEETFGYGRYSEPEPPLLEENELEEEIPQAERDAVSMEEAQKETQQAIESLEAEMPKASAKDIACKWKDNELKEEDKSEDIKDDIEDKPNTPQSEPDLQIDEDRCMDESDDDLHYEGLRFDEPPKTPDITLHPPKTPDISPKTPEMEFSGPPKTPDIPLFYQQEKLDKEEESEVATDSNRRSPQDLGTKGNLTDSDQHEEEKPVADNKQIPDEVSTIVHAKSKEEESKKELEIISCQKDQISKNVDEDNQSHHEMDESDVKDVEATKLDVSGDTLASDTLSLPSSPPKISENLEKLSEMDVEEREEPDKPESATEDDITSREFDAKEPALVDISDNTLPDTEKRVEQDSFHAEEEPDVKLDNLKTSDVSSENEIENSVKVENESAKTREPSDISSVVEDEEEVKEPEETKEIGTTSGATAEFTEDKDIHEKVSESMDTDSLPETNQTTAERTNREEDKDLPGSPVQKYAISKVPSPVKVQEKEEEQQEEAEPSVSADVSVPPCNLEVEKVKEEEEPPKERNNDEEPVRSTLDSTVTVKEEVKSEPIPEIIKSDDGKVEEPLESEVVSSESDIKDEASGEKQPETSEDVVEPSASTVIESVPSAVDVKNVPTAEPHELDKEHLTEEKVAEQPAVSSDNQMQGESHEDKEMADNVGAIPKKTTPPKKSTAVGKRAKPAVRRASMHVEPVSTIATRTRRSKRVGRAPSPLPDTTPATGVTTRRTRQTKGAQVKEFTVAQTVPQPEAQVTKDKPVEIKSDSNPEQEPNTEPQGRRTRRGRKKRSSSNTIILPSQQDENIEEKKTTSKSEPTDVYEFRDSDDDLQFEVKKEEKPDKHVKSEEKNRRDSVTENKDTKEISHIDRIRPRLILTIKSPMKEHAKVETREEFCSEKVEEHPEKPSSPEEAAKPNMPVKSPPGPTRKSRRLQAKDGSRTTVDDIIEEVVRGNFKVTEETATTGGTARMTRRSTRAKQKESETPHEETIKEEKVEPRKSPRSSRGAWKQEIKLEKIEEDASKVKKQGADVPKPKELKEDQPNPPPTPQAPSVKKVELPKVPVSEGAQGQKMQPDEPTTLIDPVTGLLIPMRESEEGQYIPVTTAQGISAVQPNQSVVVSTSSQKQTPGSAVSVIAKSSDKESVDAPTTVPSSTTKTPISTAAITVSVPATTVPQKVSGQDPVPSSKPEGSAAQRSLSVSHAAPPPSEPSLEVPSRIRTQSLPTALTSTSVGQPKLAHSVGATSVVQSVNIPVTKQSQMQRMYMTVSRIDTHSASWPSTVGAHVPLTGAKVPSTSSSHLSVISPSQPQVAHLPGVGAAPAHMKASQRPHMSVASSLSPAHTGTKNLAGGSHMLPSSSAGNTRTVVSIPQVPIPAAHADSHVKLVGEASVDRPKPGSMHMQSQTQAQQMMMPGRKEVMPESLKRDVGRSKEPLKGERDFIPGARETGKEKKQMQSESMAKENMKLQHIKPDSGLRVPPRATPPHNPQAQLPEIVPRSLSNLMEPPKVEVSTGGCIVVPIPSPTTAQAHSSHGSRENSPQTRHGQVMQSSLPAAAYEPSLGDVVRVPGQHVSFPHLRPGAPPHYVHSLMYQQYIQAQEAMAAQQAHIPYHLTAGAVRSPLVSGIDLKSEPDSEEAQAGSPPLELHRPSSGGAGARLAPPAAHLHSPHSTHDRSTDSPLVATVYAHGARVSHPHAHPHPLPAYSASHPDEKVSRNLPPHMIPSHSRHSYEVEGRLSRGDDIYRHGPPPAHLRSRVHPIPGSEAPPHLPSQHTRMQVQTPPHASQVPPQADSLLMLLQRYPVMWQGLLALKNDQAAVQMHFVFGNPHVARDSLPCNSDGSTPPLRIAQRMRLEQTQLEGVARKMQMENEHCMLLALPCGRDHMDVLQQSNNLQNGFITYLQQKQAAGIVNIAAPGSQQAAYVVHIFPSCDFANENLARIAPDLLHRVADIAHLLIIIATV